MNNKIEELFHISENESDYNVVDQILTEEINKLLTPYKEQLQASDYEQVRDMMFSISHMAKKYSFEVGFKVAVNILVDCFKKE